jgi:purine-binding chemotaxis protein CheW
MKNNTETELKQYFTFYMNEQLYAVELGYVQEYVEEIKVTELPKKEGSVIGMANLRGQIISMFDLKHKLTGVASKDCKESVVIRDNNSLEKVKLSFEKNYTSKEPVAIIVDKRRGVIEINKSQLKPGKNHGDKEFNSYISSMVELDDEVVLILDISELLGFQPKEDIVE